MLDQIKKNVIEKAIKAKEVVQDSLPKFQGKGTRARLNTAADKMFFGNRSRIKR